jgi:hypothetical protein
VKEGIPALSFKQMLSVAQAQGVSQISTSTHETSRTTAAKGEISFGTAKRNTTRVVANPSINGRVFMGVPLLCGTFGKINLVKESGSVAVASGVHQVCYSRIIMCVRVCVHLLVRKVHVHAQEGVYW